METNFSTAVTLAFSAGAIFGILTAAAARGFKGLLPFCLTLWGAAMLAFCLLFLVGCGTMPPRDGEILIPIPDWAEGKIMDLSDCKG